MIEILADRDSVYFFASAGGESQFVLIEIDRLLNRELDGWDPGVTAELSFDAGPEHNETCLIVSKKKT